MHRTLTRIHVWLGWLIGVPLLFWTVSGLWMVARPIEEVRGLQLKAKPPALVLNSRPVFPKLPADHGAPLSVRLEQQWHGPVWIATFAHGHEMRMGDGQWLPAITEHQARDIALRWYEPDSTILSVTHTPADAPPLDLRTERPAWGITFADGSRVYVDADTGSLLAIRSRQWRVFDWMWGLHIMDLESREDSSHPLLILFAALAAVGALLGLILLPLANRIRRNERRHRLHLPRPPDA
jgi:hypothetical protein